MQLNNTTEFKHFSIIMYNIEIDYHILRCDKNYM